MIRSAHPVAQEELMAYLDGELPVVRARECAAHLGQCSECQGLAADLKAVYHQMKIWEVGPAPDGVSSTVAAALEKHPQRAEIKTSAAGRIRQLVSRRWMWGLAAAAGLCLAAIIGPRLRANRAGRSVSLQQAIDVFPFRTTPPALDTFAKLYKPRTANKTELSTDLQRLREQAREVTLANSSGAAGSTTPAADEVQQTQNAVQSTMAPMIGRTASVNLVAKDFEKARTELEAILRRHNGYAADLKLEAPPDQGRTLTASLRVPADQLDLALAELKKLGRVEQESQGGEEVTEQYVDLNARLSNARNTEQRLVQILAQRTGRLSDVLTVEQEISRVRGEIEQMEAERKSLEHRVAYTSLDVQLKEEYKAALEVAPPSGFAQMRNALVEGVEDAVAGLVAFVRFLLFAGPTLLLWALILFFPARFIWRRWRTAAPSTKNSA